MGIYIKNILALLPGGEEQCEIYLEGGRISAIGRAPEGFVCERVIEGKDRLLTPGLVNAHTHAYMTGFRNRSDDVDFNTWLFERIMPMEDALTPEEGYKWTVAGCREMLSFGVTSFLDMHMFPGCTPRAAIETGIRAVVSRGLTGGAGDREGGERRLREARAEMEAYSNAPLVSFMLAPHAPYTCDEGYLINIAEAARELGLPVHTHLCESRGEVEGIQEKYNCTPIALFDRCGLLNERTVAAHCVYLTEEDMDILAERGVNVASNPASNLKLANGIAPVARLFEKGVNVCLGTDSAASNNSLSVLRELQLVTLLSKAITGDPTAVSAREGFLMATKNGAKALGLTDCGEIREGAVADLAVFDIGIPSMRPLGDPYSALAYSSAGMQAAMTIVDGKIVFEK